MSGFIENQAAGASEVPGSSERALTWHASRAMLPLVSLIAQAAGRCIKYWAVSNGAQPYDAIPVEFLGKLVGNDRPASVPLEAALQPCRPQQYRTPQTPHDRRR